MYRRPKSKHYTHDIGAAVSDLRRRPSFHHIRPSLKALVRECGNFVPFKHNGDLIGFCNLDELIEVIIETYGEQCSDCGVKSFRDGDISPIDAVCINCFSETEWIENGMDWTHDLPEAIKELEREVKRAI
jgi:hypothetical protein